MPSAVDYPLMEKIYHQIIALLTKKQFAESQKLINEHPNVLTYAHENATLLLEFACVRFEPTTLKWLCDVMLQRHFSVDKKNDGGLSVLHRAYLFGHHEALRILLPYSSEPHLKEWLAQRQLACVLGKKSLTAKRIVFANPNLFAVSEAGYEFETLLLLNSTISAFSDGRPDLAPIVKAIRYWQRTEHTKIDVADSDCSSKTF